MGNDVYIGHMPSIKHIRNFYINEIFNKSGIKRKQSHENDRYKRL